MSVPDVRIGTCGFSYPEWIEAGVYPAGTKSAHMLTLYSKLFPVVELNYTWYQMPRVESLERMASRVPPSFFFTAKLTRTMTHEISDEWQQQARLYCQGVEPLLNNGNLLAILLQFPPSFTRTRTNRLYLAELFEQLHSLPLAVEFRHYSWAHDLVFKGLEQRKITLVTIDAPPLPNLFPCLGIVTNPDLFYIRLHGRNAGGWYSGNMQQQFNYSYTFQELDCLKHEVILPCRNASNQGLIFFNNHVAGQAVHNARQLGNLVH
ncbi:DUF72 domain-containing protein [Desulfogranum marinum]|uniref:DUF72 domain-containing protein n=1 Tax=Desulfogranum marinum TaxID=453220 RepID=UPI0019645861|nr:DUF72 domain-containing protein [Desulfogranum marinum]MBM9511565.1 DUF72 domain-containing protein [Desulfogranum marinum]